MDQNDIQNADSGEIQGLDAVKVQNTDQVESKDELKLKLETLKGELEVAGPSFQEKTYGMGAKISACLLELSETVSEAAGKGEGKGKLINGVRNMIDALIEQKELDAIIATPPNLLTLKLGQKPSSIKKEARKARFKNVQEGGKLDIAFSDAFALYNKYS